MILKKSRSRLQFALSRVSIALGVCCFTVSPVQSQTVSSSKSNQPLLLAQAIPNYCRKSESTFLTMETKSYWVSICGGDNPNSYVGVSKKDRRQSIRVPLKDFDPRGNYFYAVNKDVEYILAKTPKGNFLTVTRGTRELLREPVLKGW
ncbi:MAG: hypothetical protein LH702_01875 [Phormidesmis sp. CAN_BIN44]|nr:hypothetical protein [Phormidesmis sp. CAN_BIN44]